MSRAVAVAAGLLVVALAVAGCSGDDDRYGAEPACPLLAELVQTGQKVAQADVSDPATFDRTLRDATKAYVRTANELRDAVPANLRGDVDQMITAAEQRRFDAATTARERIDEYARENCTLADATG
jgi:hypothetical protein